MRYPADKNYAITQEYGQKNAALTGGTHWGIDYAFPSGTPVKAITAGTVRAAGTGKNEGNYVSITSGALRHDYYHLKSLAVAHGAKVAEGQIIGYSGSTGLSTGPHLHLQTWHNGALVNPKDVLAGKYSAAAPAPAPVPNGDFFTIRSGDTFWGLEEALGIPHGTLQQLNPNQDPRKLAIGQQIRIKAAAAPAPAPAPAPAQEFVTAQPGFTMWGYESQHGIPHGTLQQLNPGINPRTIQIGQRIRVR